MYILTFNQKFGVLRYDKCNETKKYIVYIFVQNALKTLLQHIQSTFSTVLDDFFFEAQSDEALEYEETAVCGVTPIRDNVATEYMDIESAQSPGN